MKPLATILTNALAALALAGAAITPAFAADTASTRIKVSYADLDLSTFEGQMVLERRVEKAVRTVCRAHYLTTGSRTMVEQVQTCLAKARGEARVKVAALIDGQQRGG